MHSEIAAAIFAGFIAGAPIWSALSRWWSIRRGDTRVDHFGETMVVGYDVVVNMHTENGPEVLRYGEKRETIDGGCL